MRFIDYLVETWKLASVTSSTPTIMSHLKKLILTLAVSLSIQTSPAALLGFIDVSPGDLDGPNGDFLIIATGAAATIPNDATVTGWVVDVGGNATVTPLILEFIPSMTFRVAAIGTSASSDALTEGTAHSFGTPFNVPSSGTYYMAFHSDGTAATVEYQPTDPPGGGNTAFFTHYFLRGTDNPGDGGSDLEINDTFTTPATYTDLSGSVPDPRHYDFGIVYSTTTIPEPSSLTLLLCGFALAFRRKR